MYYDHSLISDELVEHNLILRLRCPGSSRGSEVMIRLSRAVRKHFFGLPFLIVAERQLSRLLDCRVRWWSTGAALAVECGTTSIALDVHLEDGGMVDQAI